MDQARPSFGWGQGCGGGRPLGQVFPVPGTASLSLAFPKRPSLAPGTGEEVMGHPSGWNSHIAGPRGQKAVV